MDSDDNDWRGRGPSKSTSFVNSAAAHPTLTSKAATTTSTTLFNPSKELEKEIIGSGVQVIKVEDKWDGEDEAEEDDGVKDNWDDEDEEIPAPTSTEVILAKVTEEIKAVQFKSKKGKNKHKFVEKEKQDEQELTAEELEAIKLREEKIRDAEELRLTKEAFGISTDKNELVDIVNPVTKDDFDGLRKKLIDDLGKFSKHTLFNDFLEDLIVDLSVCLPLKRLKKVKTSIEVLCSEKLKSEKEKSRPGAAGGKGAASKGIKLNVEGDRAILKQRDTDDFDDYDDFM